MKPLVLFFYFLTLGFLVHLKEILNKEIIYSDNFYHYIAYPELNKAEKTYFEKDLIYSSIKNFIFKKPAFNPLILKLYYLSNNLKTIGIIMAILYQIIASFIFLFFISKAYKIDESSAILYTLLFISFISNTDLFFFDLRRNIGFIFFMLTIYNFYFKNTILFLFSSCAYAFFYSAAILLILILIFFYFFSLNKNKLKFNILFFSILLIFTILNYENLINFIINTKISITKAFEWKDYFNLNITTNFIENYLFNFNEYFRKYFYYFYLIIFLLFVNMITLFIKNKKLIINIIEKREIIIILSGFLSFILGLILISPGYASRQTIFLIPTFLILIFIRSNELIKVSYNTKISNYLILVLFFIFIFSTKTDQFEKVNLKMMNFIANNTPKDSIILSHPSEKFIPYFTQRIVYIIESSEKIICTASTKNCPEVYRRYFNSLELFYTDSFKKINSIIKKEKIDYIVVSKKYYSNFYLLTPKGYDKIRKLSYQKYTQNKEKKFKILELAEKYGTKIDDSTYFIDVKKIL